MLSPIKALNLQNQLSPSQAKRQLKLVDVEEIEVEDATTNMETHWRELVASLASSHEGFKLERSRSGEASNAPSYKESSPPASASSFLLL